MHLTFNELQLIGIKMIPDNKYSVFSQNVFSELACYYTQ